MKTQRIIKFRGWSNGKMEYSHELPDFSFWKWVAYDSNTVIMEFSGLYDKNKTQIFEGDIVEWSIFPPGGDVKRIRDEVVFGHGSFAVKNRSELLGLKEPHRELIVIGNVFESEHLLKEENQDK